MGAEEVLHGFYRDAPHLFLRAAFTAIGIVSAGLNQGLNEAGWGRQVSLNNLKGLCLNALRCPHVSGSAAGIVAT